jgi:serine phosphatase RsbU (regulator of sigma subunit)
MKRFFFVLFSFLLTVCLFGQSKKLDSLLLVLESHKEDSLKVNTLNRIGKEYEFIDQKLSKEYLNKALNLASKINYQKGKAASYKFMGYLADDISLFDSAVFYYNKSFELFSKNGNIVEAADLLKLLGDTYSDQGDYSKSLDYLQRSLKLFEKGNSEDGIAGIHYSLGQLYQGLGQRKNAMKSYKLSLDMYKKLGKTIDIANGLTAVGIMHDASKEFSLAKKNYEEAEAIYLKNDYKNGLSNLYTWMAITEFNQKNLDGALNYFMKSMKLYEEINNTGGLIYVYNNIGSIYTDKKEYDKAIEYEKKSLDLAIKSGSFEYIKYSYEILANTYGKKGDFKSAFEYQYEMIKYKDSIFNATSMEQINEMQTKYETEKKDKELLLKDAEITKQMSLADRQATQRNYLFIGLGLMIIVSVLIFRSYRLKQKANLIIASQKEEVEKQKNLIEEKQKEIVDSINYAKHLQQAILPPLNFVKQHLPQSFILYKPKDIVSGDFYWMYVSNDDIYIAAADCTGHGVPGAMVSVVCSNAMDRTVKEFGIKDPGQILDKVRELVVVTFEKSESEVKDGMDISLCRLNLKTMHLQWAGANNPLWIIQNGALKEIKANKQSIGKTDSPLPFITHDQDLNKGDSIFLFTDGYADQFGGSKGKKFKYKPFQEQLLAHSAEAPEDQKKALDAIIEGWKGNLQQVDDILVIGIKI